MTYNVKLEVFEGPLDLLLYLIKKEEIDIYDIPISIITEQYLEYLELMQLLDLTIAGEFLVMAATLIHIKSKLLLPPDQTEAEEVDADPRAELVKRLLEYKKFKEAASTLGQMITDAKRIKLKDVGHPDICNVFSYYTIFSTPEVQANVKHWCEGALVGCTECKKSLARILADYLGPIRDKRNSLTDSYVEDVLRAGAKKARAEASATMETVKKLINFFV